MHIDNGLQVLIIIIFDISYNNILKKYCVEDNDNSMY